MKKESIPNDYVLGFSAVPLKLKVVDHERDIQNPIAAYSDEEHLVADVAHDLGLLVTDSVSIP